MIVLRPLSTYENVFRLRTEYGFYGNFVVTATYSSALSYSRVLYAVKKVVQDYHILACNVFRAGSEYVIRPIDLIKFEDVFIDKTHDANIVDGRITEKCMKELNDIGFALYTHKPLFKIVLLDDYHLSAVFDHTLFDGLVGNYFHEALLPYLAESPGSEIGATSVANSEIFTSKDEITHSLPPPIDEYLRWDLDYTYGDPNYPEKVAPTGLRRFPGRFPNTRDYTLAFKLINLDPQELKGVLARCKKEGLTLTAYIEYVHALTFAPVFGGDYIVTKTAIALRKHFLKEKSPDHYKHFYDYENYFNMGCSPHLGVGINLTPHEEFSWDVAKDVGKQLALNVSNDRLMYSMNPFKDTYSIDKDMESMFTSKLGGEKSENVKVSNLGLIRLPQLGEWTITDMVFSQDLSSITSDFMLSAISTPLGGLNLVVTYQDHSFADTALENFDALVQQYRANLLRYAADL